MGASVRGANFKLGFLVLCAVICCAQVTRAQDIVTDPQAHVWFPPNEPAHILPYYGQGVATDNQLEEAVGAYSFAVAECHNEYMPPAIRRSVAMYVSKPGFESAPVIEALLFKAAQYGWNACPLQVQWFDNTFKPDVRWTISRVDVYYQNARVLTAGELCCDDTFRTSREYYRWQNVTDLAAIDRQKAAEEAAANTAAAARAADEARSDYILGVLGRLIFWSIIALAVFVNRERLLRLWFSLTPHPAARVVQESMSAQTPLSESALEELFTQIVGGDIEKEVRRKQAQELAARAHQHFENLRRAAAVEVERVAWQIVQKEQKERLMQEAQTALINATVSVERVKARMAAIKKWDSAE